MTLIDKINLWLLKRSAIKHARKIGKDRVAHVERYFAKLYDECGRDWVYVCLMVISVSLGAAAMIAVMIAAS